MGNRFSPPIRLSQLCAWEIKIATPSFTIYLRLQHVIRRARNDSASKIMDNKYPPLAGMKANKERLSKSDSLSLFKLEYPIFQEALSFSSEF
jgi:hypothetical protein